jgi:glycosyltransferase involved in cell wall biosynthesis
VRAVVVCPVVPHPPSGGAEKRTLRLLEAMERAGVTPHLVTADESRPEGAAALRARGWAVDVRPEPAPSRRRRIRQHLERRPSPYLGGVARRLAELRAEHPAFVQVEHVMSAYYGPVLPAPRSVLSTHNVDSAMLRTIASGKRGAAALRWRVRAAATAAVERREAPRAGAVLCVSDEDAAYFERLGGTVVVAPNGVDGPLFDIPAELPEEDRLLFFGNLGYEPNAHGLRRFLREGWPRLLAARPGARLRVAGPGQPDAELARLMDGPVEHVGLVDDIAAELAACRAVLVPVWQGGGTRLKVLEALAAARPVAGTPLGVSGIGVRDGVHAAVEEAPAALAAAAAALLADGARGAALAAEGRRLAERYRWEIVTAPAAELYARWSG